MFWGFFSLLLSLNHTRGQDGTKSWIISSCSNHSFCFSIHAVSFTSVSTVGAFHLPSSGCVQCRWLCLGPPVICGTQRCDEGGGQRSALGGQGLHVGGPSNGDK